MTAVLQTMGYGPVESMELFLSRFISEYSTNLIDPDLLNVWVCHKKAENITELQTMLIEHGHDLHNHHCHPSTDSHSKLIIKKTDQDQFVPSVIMKKILSLHCCLANYMLTQCLVLYNWGVRSFELLFADEEFLSKIRAKKTSCKVGETTFDEFTKLKYFLNKISVESKSSGIRLSAAEKGKRNSYHRGKVVKFSRLREICDNCKYPFQELRRVSKDPEQETFNKNRTMYNLKHRFWPENHALSSSTPDELLLCIIQMRIRTELDVDLRKECYRWITLKRILNHVLIQHKAIVQHNGYGRILNHHLKNSDYKEHRRNSKLQPIPNRVICSYVKDLLRRILPLEFFGSNRLKKKFFHQVNLILCGSKDENFMFRPLTQLFSNCSGELPWLLEIGGWTTACRILLKVIKWLLLEYVFVVLRIHFYVTEVGSGGYRLFYYRKGDIDRAIHFWVKRQISKRNLCPVNESMPIHANSLERIWLETGMIALDNKNSHNMFMSPSKEYIEPTANVRFLPKNESTGELRMITNFRAKRTKVHHRDEKRIRVYREFMNRKVMRECTLKKVKLLLQYLKEKYGTGISPLPNNPKLEIAWRKALHLKQTFGKLYFVKADITDAFGSIIPELLSEILEEKLSDKNHETMQLKGIEEYRMQNGSIQSVSRLSFSSQPKENSLLISRSKLICKKKKYPSYQSLHLKRILDQIILNQTIKINSKSYKVMRGVLQGSAGALSPLLCDLYYSEMDHKYFGDIMKSQKSILIRGVDDYLMISADMKEARKFRDLVYGGIDEFNAKFNQNKMKSNLSGEESKVSYLGLVFDVETMNVKPDYQKHRKRDLLSTMKLSDRYGDVFFRKRKFMQFRSLWIASLKLQPIVLNGLYNAIPVAREVVFGACLMQSNRILVLVRWLFLSNKKNDLDVAAALSKSLMKIKNLVTRLNQDISRDEIGWLFWVAAKFVFMRFSGCFGDLLHLIRHRIQVTEKKLEKSGKGLILDYLKKDLNSNESWAVLLKNFKMITALSKPSRKMNI